MDIDLLRNFIYFVNEREGVRINKRDGAPQPWTDDPILQKYRFCNIRRADDRVSLWIHHNWLFPNVGHENLPIAMLLARIINVPETLEEVGFPYEWDRQQFLAVLRGRMNRGSKTWTSAYMVTGTESKGMTKAEYTALLVERALPLQDRMREAVNLWNLSQVLQRVKGVSTFMAGQVIADLKYVSPWVDTVDWETFAVQGPGSVRGLHRLYKRNYNATMGDKQFTEELVALSKAVSGSIPSIHNQDLQNCLCEWDKYRRALEGQGAPKQIYVPYQELK